MADISYGRVPFEEQIAFFRAKKNVLTESYLDVWAEEHDVAFMVAGANRDALLADFRHAIDKVIAQGGTLAGFRKDFDAIVERYGWEYTGGRNWRSRVIYETNLRTSYAAGRWVQLQALIRDMPFWEYIHADGEEHPRPLHLSWNGLILRADDPWWLTHYGPNGYGCQCTARARSKRDLARMGKSGPDTAPPIDMQMVTVGQRSPYGPGQVQTPAGIDPGFGYAPGRSVAGDGAEAMETLRAPAGVPPIRARIARGVEAPFDAADARYAELPEAQARALFDIERTIADAKREYARGVAADGTLRVAVTGTRTAVDLRAHMDALKGLVLTHNHPRDIGFSFEDVATATLAQVAEVRVVSTDTLYRLAPLAGARWPSELLTLSLKGSPLRRDLLTLLIPYRRQLQRTRPRPDDAVVERLVQDRLVLLLARRFGLSYQVITR